MKLNSDNIIDCLLNQSFIIGRYMIDHDPNITMIGLIVHIFTSFILLFSSYALVIGILPYWLSIIIILVITTLCILYSFCSRLIVLILFTISYQYLMAFGAYYFIIINNNDNGQSPSNKIMVALMMIMVSFTIQILFCHKYCMGSMPRKVGPKWFPSYNDVLLKQFNEPYLILMAFTIHYRLFGIDSGTVKLAKYYKNVYSKRK